MGLLRSRTTRVDLETAIELSRELASRVGSGHDLVVGIEAGGLLPGRIVAARLGLPYHTVTIGRPEHREETIETFRRISGPLADAYAAITFYTMPPRLRDGAPSVEGMCVLVIDDAVHTGRTLEALGKALIEARQVTTASLSTVHAPQSGHIALLTGRFHYPWSKDHPEHEAYRCLAEAD